ncbi:ImmA/IrrE family metallo-endopeptidase [Couchioplanes caeruleus]|uniref:helix-turn-helix domain-containing protein n=1 Tax=Couchioplanes caeruleus TaxID=56438 RepID=UPI0020BEE9B7|nr:ImmA/IrrE family metallo-endopeptidase [Couchioplanes caeruleus]UQU62525.1 ImmA/IrrE family metallo-endopeptidase [Couchioplanes caeruleus]
MSKPERDPLPPRQTPVGQLLGEELEARGWSQADFAAVLDRPTQFVSEIVTGKKEITRESAAQIGAALGLSAEYWLRLQDQYLLAEQVKNKATQGKLEEVRRRALLNSKAPIQLLRKRKLLVGDTLDELEAEVMNLFELSSLDAEPEFAAAARRGNQGEEISVLQGAWVACVRKKARELPPRKSYSAAGLEDLARSLPRILKTSDAFFPLPELFAEVGVRLVYVEMLPGGKIDGCAMYVDGYPVIGLSGRGQRLDKVLFTLLHEVAHVLRGHVDVERIIAEEIDNKGSHESAQEAEANNLASACIFPSGQLNVPARISSSWIDQAATELGVARIVVVGYLQHRKRLDWRTTFTKNAPNVGHVLAAWK